MDVVLLFIWTILAGAMMGGVLALIGAQLTAREQSVQALVVSQAASLGVVAGLVFQDKIPQLPMIGSFLFGASLAFMCERLILASWPGRNTYLLAVFGFLLSITYLVTALVPSLESHMAGQFFGDLAVVKEEDSRWLFFVALFALVAQVAMNRRISEGSFDIATFGRLLPGGPKRRAHLAFLVTALLSICLSIQFFGLLFTLSSLFMVPVLARFATLSLRGFSIFVLVLGSMGSLIGFLLSLLQGYLPTVPTIAVSYVVVGGAMIMISYAVRNFSQKHVN